MGKASAPSSPNPYTSAQAQFQYGGLAAELGQKINDVNTVGPTGSTTYNTTGGGINAQGYPVASNTTQTTTLSPAEQAILSGSQGLQQQQINSAGNLLKNANTAIGAGAPSIAPVVYGAPAAGGITTGIDTSNVPGIQSVQGLNGIEQNAQATALAGEEAAMNPGLTQSREQLDASLRNSGSHPGDPAYDNAMSALDASQASAQTQAAGAAITAGTGLENTVYGEQANTNSQLFGQAAQQAQQQNTAQSQQFGEGVTQANLSNTAGQTALSDWAQQTGVPLNELNSILGSSQVTSPSAVSPTPQNVSSPDIMSAFQNQYAGQLSQYNAGVATTNGLIGDAATVGSLALMFA
jgi:hypothetical protein